MVINRMKIVWLLAISLILISSFCLYYSEVKLRASIRGDLVFAELIGNVAPVFKIEVTNNKDVVTLYNDNNLWRVSEADNYYADFNRIHKILSNIATAKIGNEANQSATNNLQWHKVSLFDKQNKNLGEAFLSDAVHQNIRYVLLPNKDKIYFTTWNALFPKQLASWTRQPLISFEGTNISKLMVDGKGIYRNYEGDIFYNIENKQKYHQLDYVRIFNTLQDLYYDNVLSSKEFDKDKYPNSRTQKLITFGGLIMELQYATDYKEYWVKVNLSTTSLPSNAVIDYIKDNNIFYQDWWFRLPTDEGRSLFMFNL